MQNPIVTNPMPALHAWARALKIAGPWTWKPLPDGGAVITSRPRGYEPREFTFTAAELAAGPRMRRS